MKISLLALVFTALLISTAHAGCDSRSNIFGGHDIYCNGVLKERTKPNILGGHDTFNDRGQQVDRTKPNINGGYSSQRPYSGNSNNSIPYNQPYNQSNQLPMAPGYVPTLPNVLSTAPDKNPSNSTNTGKCVEIWGGQQRCFRDEVQQTDPLWFKNKPSFPVRPTDSITGKFLYEDPSKYFNPPQPLNRHILE